MHSPDDTIAAIATAAGGAARGIVRISGPEAVAVASHVFAPHDRAALEHLRHACVVYGTVTSPIPAGGVLIEPHPHPLSAPCLLYLWPTARSYTRQPVAELHTIGSPPLLAALLRAVCFAGAPIG